MIVHSAGEFSGAGGTGLYRRSWLPAGQPRAHVAVVHGYAEHSGRYEWVGEQLAGAGIAVHAYDLRGHGKSDGPRVLVGSFKEHLDDLEVFLGVVRDEAGGAPVYLLGHSMGGCIVALEACTRQPEVAGLILSGPAVAKQGVALRLMGTMMAGVAKVRPGLGIRSLAAETVSRDPAVVAAYDSDPLVYRGKVPVGMVTAMSRAVARINRDAFDIRLPLLIVHGTADELCDIEGSRDFYAAVGSLDRTLKEYEGLAHEVLNEPEKATVLWDIRDWIEAHLK